LIDRSRNMHGKQSVVQYVVIKLFVSNIDKIWWFS